MWIGAKHLYLIDYAAENLPNLKSTIETTYPDVRVSGGSKIAPGIT
jgi:hypothetical protein